jgi:sugar transferase (PEP-CTERM/EpsH1 system associated)
VTSAENRRCVVVHVVHSFSVGGLENVVVQLINRLPVERFEHVVLALTTISDFRFRVQRRDVRFIALDKAPGHAIPLYPRIVRLLREIGPDVLHTCNFSALEIVPLGWLARVPLRVHAEHGWDAHDPRGENLKYQLVRRFYRPFVSRYVAVSEDIDRYLAQAVGVPSERRSLIANGVDTDQFTPPAADQVTPADCPFNSSQHWIVGTVGRLQTVKNQPLLARAFVRLLAARPQARAWLRLVVVGEGPLRAEVERILDVADARSLAWLPGARDDVAALMRSMNTFVLPSQTEGTSCTIQEAMACGLPVVATAVGGTPDLIDDECTGLLVPPEDEAALSAAIWRCSQDPGLCARLGQAARARAVQQFGLDAMVARYEALWS